MTSWAQVLLRGAHSISRDSRAESCKEYLPLRAEAPLGLVVVVAGSKAPKAPLSPHGYLQPLWVKKKQMGEVRWGRMAGESRARVEPWVGVS